MRTDIKDNRGARKFIDVTKEGPPRFPGDLPVENEAAEDEPPELQDDSDDEPEGEEQQVKTRARKRAKQRKQMYIATNTGSKNGDLLDCKMGWANPFWT